MPICVFLQDKLLRKVFSFHLELFQISLKAIFLIFHSLTDPALVVYISHRAHSTALYIVQYGASGAIPVSFFAKSEAQRSCIYRELTLCFVGFSFVCVPSAIKNLFVSV